MAYSEQTDTSTLMEECKTYNYDDYINRLKILYSARNGLNDGSATGIQEKYNVQQRDNNDDEIELN